MIDANTNVQNSRGSHASGDPAPLAAGLQVRVERPATELADFVHGYHCFASDGPSSTGQVDWFLPEGANVRFIHSRGGSSVAIGARSFPLTTGAYLFGPTSCAIRALTNGGTVAGFTVSPLGWARLTGRSAGESRDTVGPASCLISEPVAQRLLSRTAGCTADGDIKTLFDATLTPLLARPAPDEAEIRALMVLIDEGHTETSTVCELMGISAHTLRRLSVRYFGLTPKLLMLRARFLRSLLRYLEAPESAGYSMIGPGYFDTRHFLRDAQTFLGMTPRRFRAMPKPFLAASIRARTDVLGRPTQALHAASPDRRQEQR